jgi:hypothetical protein
MAEGYTVATSWHLETSLASGLRIHTLGKEHRWFSICRAVGWVAPRDAAAQATQVGLG